MKATAPMKPSPLSELPALPELWPVLEPSPFHRLPV